MMASRVPHILPYPIKSIRYSGYDSESHFESVIFCNNGDLPLTKRILRLELLEARQQNAARLVFVPFMLFRLAVFVEIFFQILIQHQNSSSEFFYRQCAALDFFSKKTAT